MKENPNVTVVIANKVCVKKGMVMRKEFVDSLQVWLKLFLAWLTLAVHSRTREWYPLSDFQLPMEGENPNFMTRTAHILATNARSTALEVPRRTLFLELFRLN